MDLTKRGEVHVTNPSERARALPQTIEATSPILINSPASNKKDCLHVLHVDDDLCLLEVSKQILMMENSFEIDTATSVDEAFKKMEQQNYDAIISDYVMPQKDGLQFLQGLRERQNSIPFVIFTGKGREEVAIRALNLGADQYLNKTGDPETVYCELAHAIRQAVDRRSAQIKVLEREAKLNAILESSPEAITITDLDGNIVECNKVTADLHGVQSKEDLVGKNAFGLIAERDREKATQTLKKKTIAQGSVKSVEYTLLTEGGREFPGELSASVVKDASGKPELLVAITRDITERKKAEEALRESEEKFKGLVESTSDWIWQTDKKGVYVYVSPKIKDIGYEPEEVVGKTPFDLMPKDEARRTAKFLGEIAEKKEAFHGFEKWVVHKNGTAVLLETSGIPIFDQKGDLVGYRGVDRDVTQRKKAEGELRRLATIVTDSNDAITVVDMDGRITAWNKGAEDTYGYHKDEALGMGILKIVPEDKKQETLDVIGKIKTNETVGSFETKRLAKDGRILDVWLTVTKLVDDEGNAVALATTERDITEKKRLAREIALFRKVYYPGPIGFICCPRD